MQGKKSLVFEYSRTTVSPFFEISPPWAPITENSADNLFYFLQVFSERCKISTTEENIRKKRILLVDDEPDITIALEAALEESGFFQVDTFNDAESTLSGFKPGHYDLALLDIRMPETDGFDLFRKLREIDNKLKICFLTAADLAYYRKTDSDVMDELGNHCFVAKPVDNIDLINRLKVILSRK